MLTCVATRLLTLFGERVTMQFMSQSTGWADNIILAMAPLGIITAIIGAIRVGGPTWLKTIIGRARESRAIVEAELMSSTSKEVCELWNGQQIVRVMGAGPIREFIILLPEATGGDSISGPKASTLINQTTLVTKLSNHMKNTPRYLEKQSEYTHLDCLSYTIIILSSHQSPAFESLFRATGFGGAGILRKPRNLMKMASRKFPSPPPDTGTGVLSENPTQKRPYYRPERKKPVAVPTPSNPARPVLRNYQKGLALLRLSLFEIQKLIHPISHSTFTTMSTG
jgi:hypothetical protein